jgi:hypothetical protein
MREVARLTTVHPILFIMNFAPVGSSDEVADVDSTLPSKESYSFMIFTGTCPLRSTVFPACFDLPMSKELEARLRTHLQKHDSKNDLLFVNGRSRPLSANKLRAKQLHPF